MEENRRNVEEALCTLAIHSVDFVRSVREDPESALWSYGFALSPSEMRFVKDYLGENAKLEDKDIIEKLQQPRPMLR